MRAIWPVTTLAIAGCMGSEIAPEKEAWQGTYFPPTGSSGAALTADQAASMAGLTFPQTYDDMVSTFGQPHRRDGGYDIYIGPDGRNYWVRYDETNTAISLEIK